MTTTMPRDSASKTTTVKLCGWHDEINDSVRALLFGELVRRATPIMTNYQSDLFHDAHLIQTFAGPVRFFFGVREWGTHLLIPGSGGLKVEEAREIITGHCAHVWWVSLYSERGYWMADFTEVQIPEEPESKVDFGTQGNHIAEQAVKRIKAGKALGSPSLFNIIRESAIDVLEAEQS